MSIQRHVFEAMMIIAKPVTAREIHKRARGLRYTSEQIGVALRAMARRGIVVETRPERPRVAAQYILVGLSHDQRGPGGRAQRISLRAQGRRRWRR